MSVPLLDGLDRHDLLRALRKHTISGYYLPFLSTDHQNRIANIVQSGSMSRWRRTIGGLSRTRQIMHPLKSCRQCVLADLEAVGRAYWHVDFQFPTTWICRQHGLALSATSAPSKRWALPDAEAAIADPEPAVDDVALVLAELGARIHHLPVVDVLCIREAAVARLRELGVLHSENSSRHERIERWFSSTATSLLCKTRGEGLEHLATGDWIAELLWRKRLNHAARWVTLWSALEWPSALEAATAFTDAANGLRLDRGTQLSIFEDTPVPSLPAPCKVYDAFSKSDSYGEVMAMLQASRGDVVRWLEQDPVLRAEWRHRLKMGKQRQCMDRIQAMASIGPNLTRQEIESNCSAEIRWLREHAPTLLHAMLKSVPGRASAQRSLFQTESAQPFQHPSSAANSGEPNRRSIRRNVGRRA
jgi:hypothetical protein